MGRVKSADEVRKVILMVKRMAEQPTYEELMAENARLKATKEKRTGGISFKVSEKGAVSVYGLGRFPVTLYKEQWLRLLDLEKDIREFITQNEDKLKAKE
jgi:tRNA uridine 5-carbamoylmethylation protein Kti12